MLILYRCIYYVWRICETKTFNKQTLRKFCLLLEEDASNWSKVERGKISPPQDKQKLTKIATILGLNPDSSDWYSLFDYADIDVGKIPDYILSDKELVKSLPVYFRNISESKPTSEELTQLVNIIRNNH